MGQTIVNCCICQYEDDSISEYICPRCEDWIMEGPQLSWALQHAVQME